MSFEQVIVATRWFTGSSTDHVVGVGVQRTVGVGVVVISVPIGPNPDDQALKAYIAPTYDGDTEKSSAWRIVHGGVRIHDQAVLDGLFPSLADLRWYDG